MKIKVQLVEGYWTTNWKEPIEIETEDYPELKGMEEGEALAYILKNADEMPADPKEPDAGFSVQDWANEQDVEYSKEKNYDSSLEKA
jgi:hypothetical protein